MAENQSFNAWRVLRLVLIASVVLAATGVVSAYGDAWHEKSEATRFIKVLSTIQVGIPTENDANNAARSFAGYKDTQKDSDSRNLTTAVAYTFQNRVMAFLHLAPPKYLYAGLEFRNGVVISKSINFYQQPRSGVVVQEILASGISNSANINARQVRTNAYGPGLIVINVHDDNSVPLSRRQLDWEIDLSWLARMGPCRNPQSMLPGIFPQMR